MPAGQPSVPGGLARENLLMRVEMESAGADTSISFKSCIFDSFANQGVIGGDSSFVGFMDSFRQGKLIQSAALPSTVIPGGNVVSLHMNEIDNGIIAVINGLSARSADGGATWTAIASTVVAFATTALDVLTWRGSQLVSGNTKQTIPDRNYSVSLDNGVTWAGQFFSGATSGSPRKMRKTPDGSLLAMVGQNSRLDITTSADLTAAVWTSFDFLALFGFNINMVDIAFNGDGSKAVCISVNGDIVVSIDGLATFSEFDRNLNYFKQGTAGVLPLDWIVFVPAFDGFVLGNTEQAAFIPEAGSLNSMTVVNLCTNKAMGIIEDACSMTDGNDVLVPASSNAGLLSPRPAT
jgi:hypothetical protein